jgi:hypothetical protein
VGKNLGFMIMRFPRPWRDKSAPTPVPLACLQQKDFLISPH